MGRARYFLFGVGMAALALALAACGAHGARRAPSDAGVAAFRNKDYASAWAILKPLSDEGRDRAQRYVAMMLLRGHAPVDCRDDRCVEEAVALLMEAARRRDNHALIALEGMRARGAPFAPTEARMIELEMARAERGDPMMAWRLAQRFDEGDGVAASSRQAVRWLRVAARGDPDTYPAATKASYRLCQIYARGAGVRADLGKARSWCRKAAAGSAAAAIAYNRLDMR